ncbi:putative folate metabolism gamma-glutamate ligase, partial [Candidatus Curtissbacteria bacterium]|nr:putative folate metabolism gamma-glutamate ligase [Candidatus Curtissbacteria bacterium]
MRSAKRLWGNIRRAKKIKKLGVIISDSCSIPLRLGAVGVAIGFFGFEP